ncbi:hypothetical protein [Acetobacter okinawensis]|uniref:hypothetical protein n=1 Tax=Acetobacter okinawensis TaxID=1076594 RepID=UPI001177EED3|nr:hypothetical protein [Acetobacter okinawensis]
MKNNVFSIYRIKFIKPRQESLPLEVEKSNNFFLLALDDLVSGRCLQGEKKIFRWHIGNLLHYEHLTGYFAFGRTTRGKIEKFDEKQSVFLQEEQDESPYTHCVFNAEFGLVAIANKYTLAKDTKEISKKMEKVLSRSYSIIRNKIKIEILPIPNPDSFVKEIQEAHRIFSLTASFGRPNPFDADAYFQQPLARLLAEAHGQKGQATIEGESLQSEVVSEIAKSSAATGNTVSARIQRHPKDATRKISLHDNALKRAFGRDVDPKTIIKKITSIYMRLRHDVVS